MRGTRAQGLGRFAAMTGRLLASCNHRESVCWRRPVTNGDDKFVLLGTSRTKT